MDFRRREIHQPPSEVFVVTVEAIGPVLEQHIPHVIPLNVASSVALSDARAVLTDSRAALCVPR